MSPTKQPHFIYLCGCDGTGKSTQAKKLLAHLQNIGLKPHHLWLRFSFFFSLPLLVYARWHGLSWFEEINGLKYGYWDFGRSRLLQLFLPWTLFFDAALAAVVKIYLPLGLGQTVVCERFVLDMLADLMVAFNDPNLHRRLPGRLYPYLLPRQAAMVMLDLDAATIRARRPDLQADRRLEARLEAFRRLAADQKLTLVSSQLSVTAVEQSIWAIVWRKV
jgi:thymidylate kinase